VCVFCGVCYVCVAGFFCKRALFFHGFFCKQSPPHCNALHRTASHCNILHRTATHCNTLQHMACSLRFPTVLFSLDFCAKEPRDCRKFAVLQGGDEGSDVGSSCRSFSANEPLITGLFCRKLPHYHGRRL